MEIEIVEFYPIIKDFKRMGEKNMGQFHVYLCDYDIDIAGVIIQRKKGNHYIKLPLAYGYTNDTNERCFYPVFKFCNPEKNSDLRTSIKEKAQPFLENWFLEHPKASKVAKRMGYA